MVRRPTRKPAKRTAPPKRGRPVEAPPHRVPPAPPEWPGYPVPRPPKGVEDCDPYEELCCCGLRFLISACVEAETVAVGSEIDLEQFLLLRADANAAIRPPSGPAANADGSGRQELRQLFRKPKDCVLLLVTYRICYEIERGCGPYRIELTTAGDVVSAHHCPHISGCICVSTARLYPGDAYGAPPRGGIGVRGVVVDCQGKTATSTLILPGA